VSRIREAAGKSVGEHEDDEGNSIWGGGEEVLTREGLSTEAGFGRRGTTTVARCGGRGGRCGPQGGGGRVREGPKAAFHGEVPVEEAADGKLVVVAWTIGRWRRMMGREGGRSSGGAS
jgi:hypothetical protein